MEITISKKKIQSQILQGSRIEHPGDHQQNYFLYDSTRQYKQCQNSRQELKQRSINPCSHHWILGDCLRQQKNIQSVCIMNHMESSNQNRQRPRQRSCFSQGCKSSNRESKLVVTGTRSKTNENERTYPKSLSKLRQIRSQQLTCVKNFSMQQKCNEILKTKRCTDSHQSPSLSKNSSKQVFENDCVLDRPTLDQSKKKIQLTISKKLDTRGSISHTNNQRKSSLSKHYLIPPQVLREGCLGKRSFVQSDMVKGNSDGRSNIHSSVNQFKIIDPLDELQSQNTQRLKKMMAFSWVKSEREDDLVEKLQIPLLTIRQSSSQYSQGNKMSHPVHKSMAVLGRQPSNSSIKKSNMISGQSFVQMKGASSIFQRSFHQQLSINQTGINLSDSVLEITEPEQHTLNR